MWRGRFLRDWFRPGVGALVGVIAIAGMATLVNAHNGTPGIHSCVNTSSGEIQIVGANETCAPNRTPLDWSIQGPPGAAGPPGPPGPAADVSALQTRIAALETRVALLAPPPPPPPTAPLRRHVLLVPTSGPSGSGTIVDGICPAGVQPCIQFDVGDVSVPGPPPTLPGFYINGLAGAGSSTGTTATLTIPVVDANGSPVGTRSATCSGPPGFSSGAVCASSITSAFPQLGGTVSVLRT